MLEEGRSDAREAKFAELRALPRDKELARDFLIRSSMIWSVRRAAEVTLNWSTVAWQNADKTTSMEFFWGSAMKSFVTGFDWRLFPVDRLLYPPSGALNPKILQRCLQLSTNGNR